MSNNTQLTKKRKQYTKTIVVTGFIIMASLCILGIGLIYKELVRFSNTSDTTTERRELVTTSNLLASIYKIESVGNLLISEVHPSSSIAYDSLKVDAFTQIDSLKKITNDTIVTAHLDSIKSLLELKVNNVKRMVLLVDSINTEPPKEIIKKSIISRRDYSNLQNVIYQSINRINNSEDSVFIKSIRKNFLERVRNVFVDKTDSSLVVSRRKEEIRDSILVPVLIDTLTQYIQELSWNYEARHRYLTQQLVYKQNEMYRMNENLSSQINIILRSLEQREYETTINLIRKKEIALKRSSEIVSIIGILASFTTLVFLIMVLTSINNSLRYRKRLIDANNYAENLLESRKRLILSITHDIKAPISSIIGYTELISRQKLSEKERYYIENMQSSSEHILELVRNLLDYHSLESDKQEIQMMPFFPAILFKDIYHSFVPIAQKANVDFKFESYLKDTQNYESDPYRIRQICENLLSNAIKFTPPTGTVVFLVVLIPTGENTDLLTISVKDTGFGISEEDQKNIFEEFNRSDSHKKWIEGSGLGLTITKKLVDLLNGKIILDSQIKKGSQFIVEIPMQKIERGQFEKPESCSHNPETNTIPNKKDKNILFIDDDIVLLNLYSELFKSEGFQITICKNPLEALSLIGTTRFDLIFSDIQMPNMNGFELVERIRMGTFDGAQTIPVIALSGSSQVSEQKFIEAGFSGFISKPFTSKSILDILYKFFGGKDINSPETRDEKKGIAALMEFALEDIEAGKNIVQTFINESRKNIQLISNASKQQDWTNIKKIAHKMLALMRMVSADELVSVLFEIETGEENYNKINILIKLTEQQIAAAEKFLKTI